jgi:DNA-binding PadR family transcriptional regulator
MASYDLKRIFDDTIGFFWITQMSQIYRGLNKLEGKELVKSEIVSQEKDQIAKFINLPKKAKKYF